MNVLIIHFSHPEGYPPALNAINRISEKVDNVTILSTDTLSTAWIYNENVSLDLIPGDHDRFRFASRSKVQKIKTYFNFFSKTFRYIKSGKFDLVILYDDLPFLFYVLASYFLNVKLKVWFHSHDVYPLEKYKKFSINWYSAIFVQKYFNKIDYFSLPAIERKHMFPLSTFKGLVFYIPNYPSNKIIKERVVCSGNDFEIEKTLKLVYPGSPSIKNGFEELVNILSTKVNEKQLELFIIGDTRSSYKTALLCYASERGVAEYVNFIPRISYVEMTDFIKKFDIGWAVYKPVDLSVATAGTSSNKIYEFLANGLPIIVLDNEHHRNHLGERDSVFFSDLSQLSLKTTLSTIDSNLKVLQGVARKEFEAHYLFESAFDLAFLRIQNEIQKLT